MVTKPTTEHPVVLLESSSAGAFPRSYCFAGLEAVISAETPEEVAPALAEVEAAVASGRHAAGFVAYEAAAGLNPDLPQSRKGAMPLVWFGIFAERLDQGTGTPDDESGECRISRPCLTIDREAYLAAVAGIREAIARGETYQVNFTARQSFRIDGDPYTLYRRMCRNQQAPFCAWLDIGTHRLLSASPELFFALDNDILTMKPMKGTAACLPDDDDDRRQREGLAASSKERAENLMIVDLVRNDLSRISEVGSVAVPSLFEVETFPTVHQMTSTVTARVRKGVGLTDIFRALFPCGSVTGAPKRRSMEIIVGLEESPRGVYCGAIGYVSPGREAVFSVAIRTAVVETATGNAEIGVGSGITWGSEGGSELSECLAKGAFLARCADGFNLIESLRFDSQGYLLLDRHLQRMRRSADHFGFSFDEVSLRTALQELARGLTGGYKIRILLSPDGSVRLETAPVEESVSPGKPAVARVSNCRVDSADPFLYHKTSRRELYDRALREHPDSYDVIFLNQYDEVTEGCFNTVVISLNGELLTPRLECGLLPGVLREELLEVGALREAFLTLDDLLAADAVWLVNSVRGWRECKVQM